MNGSQQALEQACATVGLDADGARLLRLGSNAVYHLKAPVVVRVSRPGTDIVPVRRTVAVARWLESVDYPAGAQGCRAILRDRLSRRRGDPAENRGEVAFDLRSTLGPRVSRLETATGGPAPQGGTANSASAKVPSGRLALQRPQNTHQRWRQAPRGLREL
jgi:hypothetical protein